MSESQTTQERTRRGPAPGTRGVLGTLLPKPRSLTPSTQLSGELQDLRELEAELDRQEREVDEDTTVTIPSAVCVP